MGKLIQRDSQNLGHLDLCTLLN